MSLLSLMFYNMWIVVITADLVVIDLDVCKKSKRDRPHGQSRLLHSIFF